MKRFISKFKLSQSGCWDIPAIKREKYTCWLFIGKVSGRANMTGYLIIIGPIYYIFNLV